MLRRPLVALALVGALTPVVALPRAGAQDAPCNAGDERRFTGTAGAAEVKTYEAIPFEVGAGVTRIEVTYDWEEVPLPAGGIPIEGAPEESTFDLGLWDPDGLGDPEGFRGWSGSRGGRVSRGQEPVFVQQDTAARGYVPAPIDAGSWTVDLGIAALSPGGATWTVTVACTAPDVGEPFEPAPVDAGHVADDRAGWYHGDFHMHGFHSNPNGPEHQEVVDRAVAAGLDMVILTEYVTGQHWDELGPIQEANPDVLIWPGREIITYFGHAMAIGETPSVLDYRHGAAGVSLAEIQAATVADGALFGVNHPTTFPEAEFGNFCRGCEFTLGDVIDWDLVTTYEVVNNIADLPFTQTAVDAWEQLLLEGHRLTAVSGSDSKGREAADDSGYGSSATAIYASELSRAGIGAALRAGRAYVRVRGVAASPEVEVAATAADGSTAMVGDTLVADVADLEVTVRGGLGHTLELSCDGEPTGQPVTIDDDPFTFTAELTRVAGSGPLGTFCRIDTRDATGFSTIGNPVFLADRMPAPPPTEGAPGADDGAGDGDDDAGAAESEGGPGAALGGVAVAATLLALAATRVATARRRTDRSARADRPSRPGRGA